MRKKISMIVSNPEVLPSPFEDNLLQLLNNAGISVDNYEEENLEVYYAWIRQGVDYYILNTGFNSTSREEACKAFIEWISSNVDDKEYYQALLTLPIDKQLEFIITTYGYYIEESDVPFEEDI